ncbi:hypothetical protein Tco_0954390, partial [Tanacetum coccineum]
MHANKSFNRNNVNHRLYHALMEALIEDENAMDKGVVDTVKDHKRKHDDDEDDDDEDPPAGPNQVVMDDADDDVVHDEDQPQDASKPKTTKTPNPDWFTQPLRTPTPDPEWNKHQVVLDQQKQPCNIELEYNFQECFNALTDKLDWNNLEADRYPFDLSKPLPLQGPLGHRTVAVDYFFNNDLEHLKTSDPEVTYITSIMKTKAAQYEIKGIEDMLPILWSTIKHAYGKDAKKGIRHSGERRKMCVNKLHGYGHLEEIVVKRSYQQLYKFKEGDFINLHLNDIGDMLLLAVQHKLFHLDGSDIVDFIVALRMFTRSLILKRRVEDLQLGVESYQKKLNITKPQKTFLKIEFKEPYTPSYDPPGISVRDEIHHRVLDFRLDYNKEMPTRKWTAVDRKRSGLMIELIYKHLREREIIRNLERLLGARELEMDYKLMT